ncbi:toprim domain-containing protein [Variovorax sp. tm]|uniref:toprim domain-containing protein n=1 Tax=Variovorax atrisoli TaxID=3394203 RepID=UPI003A8087DA
MSFIDFARAHGVEIDPAKLHRSDKIQRCGTTEKPRSKNGAYLWDGQSGWVYAWDADAQVHWYNDPDAKPFTEEDKKAWRARREALRAATEQGYAAAAKKAAELLALAKPGPHDYLYRKGLPNAQGLCLPDGGLLVPMRDFSTNELRGVQIIRWTDSESEPGVNRWRKKMSYGMQARGAVLRLGPRAGEQIFCEGYATGLSIELAVRQMRLNATVLVCFSDSNMVHVAGLTKGSRRYVFADNDKSGAGEKAAKETGLPYCMSPALGDDANDLHKREGVLAVCALLMRVRQEVAVT